MVSRLPPPPRLLPLARAAADDEDESSEDDAEPAGDADMAEPVDESQEYSIQIKFHGGEEAGGLAFTPEDVQRLQYAVLATGLEETPFPRAVAAFMGDGEPRTLLTRAEFYSAVRALVPRDVVKGSDTRAITAFLTRFFDAFDRTGDGVVQLPDILVGFSALCAGNKSDKLVDAFSVMSHGDNHALPRVHLWRLLRAILSAFSAVASRPDGVTPEELFGRIDDAAAAVVGAAVRAVGDQSGAVAFQAFAEWFNAEGRSHCSWLELLDLAKWPAMALEAGPASDAAVPPAAAAVPPPTPGAAAAPAEEDADTDDEAADPIAFCFHLGRSALVGRAQDVERTAMLLRLTRLHTFTPAEIASVVLREGKGGSVTRPAFDRLAKRLVDVTRLSADDRKRAGALLATIFYSFDKYRRNEVNAAQLATGLLALSGGPKSCKLDVAWSLFEEGEGAPGLSCGRAWECLSSLLTGLAALCRDHVFVTVAEMRDGIDAGAVDAVTRLFDETRDREHESVVSFARFARWYNEAGFREGASWVEMLDHAKWPLSADGMPLSALPVDDETRARAMAQLGVEADDDDEEADDDDEQDGGDYDEEAGDDELGDEDLAEEDVVFSFTVSSAGDALELTRGDCDFMHAIAASAGMSKRSPADLCILQRAAAASDTADSTTIPKLAFAQAVEALIRGGGSSGEALRVARSAMRSLFAWFDWSGTDSAGTGELIAGLSVFCAESKSSKMAVAFDALDEDGAGALDHMQLWRFFRSLLLSLSFVQAGSDLLSPTDRRTVVRRVAVELTTNVFDHVAAVEGVARIERVSFQHFGGWYNDGGFDTAPWLELLDLAKWPTPSEAAAAVARRRLGLDGDRTAESAAAAAPYVGRSAFAWDRAAGALDASDEEDDDEDDEDDVEDIEVNDDEEDDIDEADGPVGRWLTPAFDFALLRRPEELRTAAAAVAARAGGLVDPDALRLTLADCAVVARIVSTGRLQRLEAGDVVALVLSAVSASRSSLTQGEFSASVIEHVLPQDDDAGAEWLGACLLRLFAYMNRESTGRASAAELASALCLFAAGSKTSKLTSSWAAFAGGPRGRLGKLGLWQLLRSLLGAVCVAPFLEEESLEHTHIAALRDEIDVVSIALTDDILRFCGHSAEWGSHAAPEGARPTLAFEDLARWYNEGGSAMAKWLELLDLSKWPTVDEMDASPRRPTAGAAAAADSDASEGNGDGDDDDADAASEGDDDNDAAAGSNVVAEIPLFPTEASPAGGMDTLVIASDDVKALASALDVTGIARTDPWVICKAVVRNASPDNTLTREGFVAVMNSILTTHERGSDRLGQAESLIWHVWYAVDALDEGRVPVPAAAAALCVLAAGNKSGKIAAAIEAAAVMEGTSPGVHPSSRNDDEDAPSLVSRDALRQVARGFVMALLGVTRAGANASPRVVAEVGEAVSRRVVHGVFLGAGSGRTASFLDFGDWYNERGCQSDGWLEMLDLRKWHPLMASFVSDPSADEERDEEPEQGDEEDDEAQGGSDDDGSGEDGSGEDGSDDDGSDGSDDAAITATGQDKAAAGPSAMRASASRDAVFGFRVTGTGEVMALSAHDVAGMSTIVRQARLDAADPQAILEAFSTRVNASGELDREAFANAISSFVDGESLGKEATAQLRSGLERLFDVFDEDASGTVDFAEFAAGFSVLCSGSKSEKLVLAFRLFDIDGDGFISKDELEQYLSAFVAALVSFGGAAGSGMARLSAEDAAARRQMARKVAAELSGTIMDQADTNHDGHISFAEFGEWYNNGGFELVPWMEMLSTSKWSTLAAEAGPAGGQAAAAAAGTTQQDAAAAATPSGPIPNDTVLLRIDLAPADAASGAPSHIELTARDARQLRRVTSASRLRAMDADTLHDLFDAEADDETGALDEQGFRNVMQRLLGQASVAEGERAVVEAYVSSIFTAFDTDGNGRVEFAEFATGFSILCAGSKSDKLGLAFRLFDLDGDGGISRVELALYIRAFLLTIITLLGGARGSAADAQVVRRAASKEAVRVAAAVFDSADADRDGTVDFVEFGEWYNDGGFELVPWLELLDQSKWPLQDDREVAMLDQDDVDQDDVDQDDVDQDEEDFDVDDDDEDDEQVDDEDDEQDDDDDAEQVRALARAPSLRPGEHASFLLLPAKEQGGPRIEMRNVAIFAGRHTAFARRLAAASALDQISPDALRDVVRDAFEAAPEGRSELQHFASVIAARARAAGVPAEECAWLGTSFPAVLGALRRSGRQDPSEDELCVALLPLCRGSKSLKFTMAADIAADRPQDRLSVVAVWTMLRCILQGLLAVRGVAEDEAGPVAEAGMGSGDSAEVRDGARALAVVVTRESQALQGGLDEEAGEEPPAGDEGVPVSFEALGHWYNSGGDALAQWLELLDLSKWPTVPLDRPGDAVSGKVTASPGAKSTRTDDGRVVVVDEEEDVEGEAEDVCEDGDGEDAAAASAVATSDDAVFRLPLVAPTQPLEDGMPRYLVFSRPDCGVVQRALRGSGLDRAPVDVVLRAASAAQRDGAVSGEALEASLRAAVTAGEDAVVDTEGRDGLTSFGRICRWVAHASAESRIAREGLVSVAAGVALSPYCLGSKSDKLAALFEAVGAALGSPAPADGGDARLEEDGLGLLLGAALIGLAASSARCRNPPSSAASMADLADSLGASVARAVVQEAGAGAGSVTFAQFGEWYNGGGYSEVQWLELLDQRKWPDVLSADDEEVDDFDEEDEEYVPEEDDDDEDEEYTSGQDEDDYEDDEDLEDLEGEGGDEDDEAEDGGESPLGPVDSEAGPGAPDAVITFKLGSGEPWESVVSLSAADGADVKAAAAASGLSALSSSELFDRVGRAADDSGRVDPDSVRSVLAGLRGASASRSASGDLRFNLLLTAMLQLLQAASALSSEQDDVFAVEDTLDADTVATCLSLCCSGTKTDKMAAAFAAAAGEDGRLSSARLAATLTAALCGILAAASSLARHPTSRVYRLAAKEGRRVAAQAFAGAGADLAGPGLTFEQFGSFYNGGGYKSSPWVELLGLGKWKS